MVKIGNIELPDFPFLKQKDGIEEDFLLQYGVNDLSIDSLEEIPNYIIRKYERIAFKEKFQTIIGQKILNIFIYGNQNFKNEVNKILLNSKIETILEDVKIEDISDIDSHVS